MRLVLHLLVCLVNRSIMRTPLLTLLWLQGIRSFRAVQSKDPSDDKQWLTFWLLYALFDLVRAKCHQDTVTDIMHRQALTHTLSPLQTRNDVLFNLDVCVRGLA
jgi:hypothetical protein